MPEMSVTAVPFLPRARVSLTAASFRFGKAPDLQDLVYRLVGPDHLVPGSDLDFSSHFPYLSAQLGIRMNDALAAGMKVFDTLACEPSSHENRRVGTCRAPYGG